MYRCRLCIPDSDCPSPEEEETAAAAGTVEAGSLGGGGGMNLGMKGLAFVEDEAERRSRSSHSSGEARVALGLEIAVDRFVYDGGAYNGTAVGFSKEKVKYMAFDKGRDPAQPPRSRWGCDRQARAGEGHNEVRRRQEWKALGLLKGPG